MEEVEVVVDLGTSQVYSTFYELPIEMFRKMPTFLDEQWAGHTPLPLISELPVIKRLHRDI